MLQFSHSTYHISKIPYLCYRKIRKWHCFKLVKTLSVQYKFPKNAWIKKGNFCNIVFEIRLNTWKIKEKDAYFVGQLYVSQRYKRLNSPKCVPLPPNTVAKLSDVSNYSVFKNSLKERSNQKTYLVLWEANRIFHWSLRSYVCPKKCMELCFFHCHIKKKSFK